MNCRGTFSGHTGPVWALAVTGNMLISASSDRTIRVALLYCFFANDKRSGTSMTLKILNASMYYKVMKELYTQ